MTASLVSTPPIPILVQHSLVQLGQRIAVARKARGLTQADLAQLANVGVSTVVSIEGGFDGVSVGNLLKVLMAMNLLGQVEALCSPKEDPEIIRYISTKLAPRRHP